MTKNRTSMADIAAHAGVSTATVSLVFNGVGHVSEDTRRRVLTAIDELGYDRPPSEHTPSTPTIGVIVPELTNPIFASFAHHLQEEISRAGGIALIRTQTPGATSEFDHLSSLIDHRVDGLIFVSGRHADLLSDLSPYHESPSSRSTARARRSQPPTFPPEIPSAFAPRSLTCTSWATRASRFSPAARTSSQPCVRPRHSLR